MPTKCFSKDKNLVTRSIAGETIIVPVRSGVSDLEYVYTLNEVSSRIWQLLDEGTPVSRIVETICAEYEVTPEQASQDIADVLRSLEAAALIHPVGEGER